MSPFQRDLLTPSSALGSTSGVDVPVGTSGEDVIQASDGSAPELVAIAEVPVRAPEANDNGTIGETLDARDIGETLDTRDDPAIEDARDITRDDTFVRDSEPNPPIATVISGGINISSAAAGAQDVLDAGLAGGYGPYDWSQMLSTLDTGTDARIQTATEIVAPRALLGFNGSEAADSIVTNANEAPTVTSGASAGAVENTAAGAVVYSATASDPDAGDSVTWSLTGADAARFGIDAAGRVSFKAAPDFEAPADADHDNAYQIAVVATDQGLLTATQAVTITVTNVNEAPVLDSNGGGDTASVSVAENTTAVTTVHATDPDAGTTLTYTIVAGADQTLFSINASSGALSFVSAPNFEAPADADHDNSYIVQVQASDGLLTDTQTITVSVTDVVENVAPVGNPDIWVLSNTLTATLAASWLTHNDSDADGDPLFVTSVTGTNVGTAFSPTVYFVPIFDLTGHLTEIDVSGTPSSGSVTFNYVLSDGAASDTTNQVTVYFVQTTGGANTINLGSIVPLNTSGYDFSYIDAKNGNDAITGANALIAGTSGIDTFFGSGGNDTLTGGAGDDLLNGGAGADSVIGGAGNDTADYSTSGSGVTINLTLGGAQTSGGDGSGDVLSGIENVTGSALADTLTGDSGANILSGGGGNDLLNGGSGDDILIGGSGVDTPTGGTGSDKFAFLSLNDVLSGGDTIADLLSGTDKLVFARDGFSALGGTGGTLASPTPLSASEFVANATGTPQDNNDHLIYNTTTHQLSYDADGNGAGGAVVVATFSNGVTLTAPDISTIATAAG